MLVMRSLHDPWELGGVTIPNRVVLAPLAGIGNWFVRLQAKRYGAGLAVSEMVSSFAIHYGNRKTLDELLTIDPREREGGPVAMQLFGQDPDIMRSAAGHVATLGADIIVNTDADNQYPGAAIPRLIAPILPIGHHFRDTLELVVQQIGPGEAQPQAEPPAHPCQRLLQPPHVDGLEQVVDGVDLERLERVLVEGGDEHDHRRIGIALEQAAGDLEAAQARHLDVEEDEVRLVRLDRADRLATVGGGGDDLHVLMRLEAQAKPLGSQRLVVNDERA